MLDRPTRDRLAESLRQIISGAMTNLALDDFLLEQAEGSEDRGVREIAMQTWLLYEEEQLYPIDITESQRCDIGRLHTLGRAEAQALRVRAGRCGSVVLV